MAASFRKGQKVQWNWGSGTAEGTIRERFERRVERTIKGSKIVRNGTSANPAFLIEQDDGDEVLKEASELSAA
jgi:hypothetical protein